MSHPLGKFQPCSDCCGGCVYCDRSQFLVEFSREHDWPDDAGCLADDCDRLDDKFALVWIPHADTNDILSGTFSSTQDGYTIPEPWNWSESCYWIYEFEDPRICINPDLTRSDISAILLQITQQYSTNRRVYLWLIHLYGATGKYDLRNPTNVAGRWELAYAEEEFTCDFDGEEEWINTEYDGPCNYYFSWPIHESLLTPVLTVP